MRASAALPIRLRALGRERLEMGRDLGAVAGHQHLLVLLQERSSPSQLSVIRQAPAPAASNTRVAGE